MAAPGLLFYIGSLPNNNNNSPRLFPVLLPVVHLDTIVIILQRCYYPTTSLLYCSAITAPLTVITMLL